jgi:site-specific recombinase XerD
MAKNYPTTRMVFDRKHQATQNKKGLVQLEVLYIRKRKWVSTGVKVFADQWSDRNYVVRAMDAEKLNERLVDMKSRVDDWINQLIAEGAAFKWESLEEMLDQVKTVTCESFIDYLSRRIEERNDIVESTKKSQRKLISSLETYGRIIEFKDLTRGNVSDYYNYLQGVKVHGSDGTVRPMSQQTVYSYMKFLKTYINDAIVHGLLHENPCKGLKLKRGESEPGRWLTEAELRRIEDYQTESASIARVRDLFLTQCYTGLSYADMSDFSPEKLETVDDVLVLTGRRMKTGEQYVVVVLEQMRNILERNHYTLPKMSNQQYNMRLKILAEACGINKPLASHWGRRTCGMLMLNRGYSMEIVARVLGHSDIKTTQKAYAKILERTVVDAFKKIDMGR